MATPRKVSWNENDARRVAAATLAYERGSRDMPPIRFRQPSDDDFFRLGTISTTWNKGSSKTVTLLKPDGSALTPTFEFEAHNHFATVTVSSGTRKVGCALYGSTWILVAAEC